MSQVNWNAASGTWTTAGDWSGNALPGVNDDVSIAVAGITVTLASGAQTIRSLSTSQSTLSLTGGSLNVLSTSSFGGAYLQSGGLLQLSGSAAAFNSSVGLSGGTLSLTTGSLAFNGQVSQTGGTLLLGSAGATMNGGYTLGASGTVKLTSGALTLQSTNVSLAGTISGAGSLVVASGTTFLSSGVSLSQSKLVVSSGVLSLGANVSYAGSFVDSLGGTVALNGNTLNLSGHLQLGGRISGGTINATAGGQWENNLLLDGTTFLVNSTINDTGNVSIGTSGGAASQVLIGKTGALHLTANSVLSDQSANGTITNLGVLAKTGGSAIAQIAASVVNASSGTISVAIGTLDFAGQSNSFSGTVTGPGIISLSAGNYVFAPTMVLSSGAFLLDGASASVTLASVGTTLRALSYGGNFTQTGGILQVGSDSLANVSLLLGGVVSLDGGTIKGGQNSLFATTGPVNLAAVDLEGFMTYKMSGPVNQSNTIYLGAQSGSLPSLIIDTTAVWAMADNASILGTFGQITNNGVLNKFNGTANSTISGTFTNNGTLNVQGSTLSLLGSGSLGGVIQGNGILELNSSNGSFALQSGLALSVGQVLIDGSSLSVTTLDANLAYKNDWSQNGGTLQLNGFNLALSGTAALDSGTVAGLGTITTSGTTTLGSGFSLGGAATLILTHGAEQTGDIGINGGATLEIARGSTYRLDADVNITSAGNGTLLVAGTVNATGTGTTTVASSVVDNGAIRIAHGEMSFIGNVSGKGNFILSQASTLDFSGPVAATERVDMSAGGSSLWLQNPAVFSAVISGFSSGDFIEFSPLNSGVVNLTLSADQKTASISDSSNHTFSVTFATAQNASLLHVGIGEHGYIGIYHL